MTISQEPKKCLIFKSKTCMHLQILKTPKTFSIKYSSFYIIYDEVLWHKTGLVAH